MPPRKEISKTALWAEEYVSWEYYEDPLVLLASLKEQKTRIYALEESPQSEDIFEFLKREGDHSCDVCLVLGSEREWVDPKILAVVDRILSIPMRWAKQSLNVSVAGAIGMYLLSERNYL